jgi:RNA-binding protein
MLKGKEKRYLRSLAHNMKPKFQVGKEGVSENLINEIDAYLNKHELLKVHVLKNCLYENEELVEIFEEESYEVVQSIGSMIVLFKRNKKEPKIKFPK